MKETLQPYINKLSNIYLSYKKANENEELLAKKFSYPLKNFHG